MKLYYAGSSCSLAANLALHEAGIAHDKQAVDLRAHKIATDNDYYAVNDKGYVPFLVLDNGDTLSEVATIVQYVADQKPELNLAPKAGTMDRYHFQEWLTYISSEIHKTVGSLFNPALHPDTRAVVITNVGKRFDWLSKKLDGKSYLMGDTYTVADGYLFTALNWCQWTGLDLAKWPVLQAFHARVGARPNVQAALKELGLVKS